MYNITLSILLLNVNTMYLYFNSIFLIADDNFLTKFFSLGITASVTITVGSLIVVIVFIVVIACCCRRTFCKQQQETSGTTSTATSVVANGTPLPSQGW